MNEIAFVATESGIDLIRISDGHLIATVWLGGGPTDAECMDLARVVATALTKARGEVIHE
jgi:hypothetical protein